MLAAKQVRSQPEGRLSPSEVLDRVKQFKSQGNVGIEVTPDEQKRLEHWSPHFEGTVTDVNGEVITIWLSRSKLLTTVRVTQIISCYCVSGPTRWARQAEEQEEQRRLTQMG
jgi:hypothetical protein